jgi:hypothetical protein
MKIFIFIALCFGISTLNVFSLSIAAELDEKEVCLQEYWKSGKPHYLIQNMQDASVQVTAYHFSLIRKEGSDGLIEKQNGRTYGPWQIAGKSFLNMDVSSLIHDPNNDETRLACFKANDKPLGILFSPSEPTLFGTEGKIISASSPEMKNSIVISNPINSHWFGDSNWFQLKQFHFNSSEIIELTLIFSNDLKTQNDLFFKKRAIESKGPLPEALIVEAVSDTIPIKSNDERIIIERNHPLKEASLYRVNLRFRAPNVTKPTLAILQLYENNVNPKAIWSWRFGVLVEP